TTKRLDELKREKAEREESLERRRQGVRFDPTATVSSDETSQDGSDPDAMDFNEAAASGGTARGGTVQRGKVDTKDAGPSQVSYTERLLEAKRRAKKNDS
ncbi:MAG: hypothetical protein AAF989_04280, partial [Planctomycetota bacterium]